MRNAMLLAAAAAGVTAFGAGGAQAQLIDGQALVSSNPTTAARAGLGVQVNPGGHITPRVGTREYRELHGDVYGRGYVDARGSGYAYAPAPSYNYDPYAYRYAPAGYYGQQSYAPQPSYAAGTYVWSDARGWIWVPQSATMRADGSVSAVAGASRTRGHLAGRVGGGVR